MPEVVSRSQEKDQPSRQGSVNNKSAEKVDTGRQTGSKQRTPSENSRDPDASNFSLKPFSYRKRPGTEFIKIDFERVTEYALEVLKHTVPDKLDGSCKGITSTTQQTNFAICPLAAAKGWGLLSLAASGATQMSIAETVAKILGSHNDIHETLKVNTDTERDFVRLFADYPKDSAPKTEVFDQMMTYYGEDEKINPLKRFCFACDHDGMRSIHEINQEFANATNNAIRYVVREDDSPCRRAVTVLVSASNQTFPWKHESTATLEKYYFFDNMRRDPAGKGVVEGFFCSDRFRMFRPDGCTCVQLASHIPNRFMYLLKMTEDQPPTYGFIWNCIREGPKSDSVQLTICFPRFTVATPLHLREAGQSTAFPFNRIFDREKSVLSGFLTHFHPFYPNLTTLWDHYHKALVTVVDGPNPPRTPKSVNLRLQVGFESRLRSTLSTWNYNEDVGAQSHRYHEEHLPPYVSNHPEAKEMSAEIVFDQPFYFVVVDYPDKNPVIQCIGRFNNLDAVPDKMPEPPAAEA